MLIICYLILVAVLALLYALSRKQFSLSFRIICSLFLSIAYGYFLKHYLPKEYLDGIEAILRILGEGYLALLKMLVVPLIIFSIIYAIIQLGAENGKVLKKISFISVSLLLGMTALASLIGIAVGSWLHVGQGLSLPAEFIKPHHVYTGLVDTLLGMLPANPIAVMAEENTIAVVIFAVFIGIAARMLDAKVDAEKMETFRKWIAAIFAIVKKLAGLVMALTPYGIFGLLSLLIIMQGEQLILGMINFIGAMYLAMVLVIGMHLIFLAFAGYNPWSYFKRAYAPLFVAFTTRSSFGTLPVTEETLRDQFKTRQITASFVPSIGATIGMNACAGIFPAMLVVMTLTILHQPLTWNLVVMVMLINALASLGISGIPGTAYIAATVTLTSLNLPYAVIALVQGIDPIVDMGRTATNVNGVLTTALVTDRVIKE